MSLTIPALTSLERLSDFTWREKLAYLAAWLNEQDARELPVEHAWADGKYIRTVRIPADTLLIGSPPLYSHLVELLSGRVLHIREHDRHEREAPFSLRTVPMCQMVVYCYSDVLARTVHTDTGERDPEKCRDAHFIPAQVDLELGRQLREREDRASFQRLLAERPNEAARLLPIYETTADVVGLDERSGVYAGNSRIHGLGVMARESFKRGDVVCDVRRGEHRTLAGRYLNHSHDPNTHPERRGENIVIVAQRPIRAGVEVTIDYATMFETARQLEAA